MLLLGLLGFDVITYFIEFVRILLAEDAAPNREMCRQFCEQFRTDLGERLFDYRREVLESLDLNGIRSSGYSYLFEMLHNVERRGWRVGEVPITFEDRRLGASKISKSEIVKALGTVLRLAWARIAKRLV